MILALLLESLILDGFAFETDTLEGAIFDLQMPK